MALQITNRLIIEAAHRRGWQTRTVDEANGIIGLTPSGGNVEYLQKSSLHPRNSAFGKIIADDKGIFELLARNANLPIPVTITDAKWSDAEELIDSFGAVVVKPIDGAHGNGITTGIKDEKSFQVALEKAHKFSKSTLLQQMIFGHDYRVLVIDGKVVAATLRKPAHVIGDGTSTIEELVEKENTRPDRQADYQAPLSVINPTVAKQYLQDAWTSVPENGQEITVVGVPNIGQGGTAVVVTDQVSKAVVEVATKAAELSQLATAGVDFLCEDISTNDMSKIALIEINATPSFGMHELPAIGDPDVVSDVFVDSLARHWSQKS